MSGKGKGKSLPEEKKEAHQRTTNTQKAGIQFSVPRVARFCRQGKYAERIGAGAPVYLASVLEYVVSEVIELAGNKAQDQKKARINPRHLMLAIKDDPELNHLLGNADFCHSGVPPKIYSELVGHNKKGKGKCQEEEEADPSQEL